MTEQAVMDPKKLKRGRRMAGLLALAGITTAVFGLIDWMVAKLDAFNIIFIIAGLAIAIFGWSLLRQARKRA
ncbi:hypothetical protein JXD38_12635 [candidate division WOR-3 bacterium]|nr:hypothetical protein [candidate division WOR-3 bacterium]